jgi:hypothetical protein
MAVKESLDLVLDKIIVKGDSLVVIHAILNHNQACDLKIDPIIREIHHI